MQAVFPGKTSNGQEIVQRGIDFHDVISKVQVSYGRESEATLPYDELRSQFFTCFRSYWCVQIGASHYRSHPMPSRTRRHRLVLRPFPCKTRKDLINLRNRANQNMQWLVPGSRQLLKGIIQTLLLTTEIVFQCFSRKLFPLECGFCIRLIVVREGITKEETWAKRTKFSNLLLFDLEFCFQLCNLVLIFVMLSWLGFLRWVRDCGAGCYTILSIKGCDDEKRWRWSAYMQTQTSRSGSEGACVCRRVRDWEGPLGTVGDLNPNVYEWEFGNAQ